MHAYYRVSFGCGIATIILYTTDKWPAYIAWTTIIASVKFELHGDPGSLKSSHEVELSMLMKLSS